LVSRCTPAPSDLIALVHHLRIKRAAFPKQVVAVDYHLGRPALIIAREAPLRGRRSRRDRSLLTGATNFLRVARSSHHLADATEHTSARVRICRWSSCTAEIAVETVFGNLKKDGPCTAGLGAGFL
jgi:hypothetical protein